MARETWREYQLTSGLRVIAKRCQCVPGLAADVVVSLHRESMSVELWLNQWEDVGRVISSRCQMYLEANEVTAETLAQWINWTDAVHVLELCHGLEFHEIYQPAAYAEELIAKLKRSMLPGWIYYTLGGAGFSLLKDFLSWGEDRSYAVEVSVQGICIYKTSLAEGCGFTESNRLLYIETCYLDAKERLNASTCWEYADEILNTQRSLRRWLFHAAAKDC